MGKRYLIDLQEGFYKTVKRTFKNWKGEDVTTDEEVYSPKNDSRYKRLCSKPINTLSLEEVVYIYAVAWSEYMQQAKQYDSPEEAVAEAVDEHGDDLKECYEFVHSLSFPLTIYRGIRVGNFKSSEKQIDSSDLNISGKQGSLSWSTNINIYKDSRSKFRNLTDIVACEIDYNIIDTANTINNFVHYTSRLGDKQFGEYEITLKPSFKQSDLHNLRMINKDDTEESLLEAKADEQKFRDTFGDDTANTFYKLKPRMKSPYNDIYYWMKKDNWELEAYLKDLASTKTDKEERELARQGAEKVYSDENWDVYHITTYQASKQYGKGSKWCITGSREADTNGMGGEYWWNTYTNQGVTFYFYFDKKNNTKYAVAVYPYADDIALAKREIFNAEDKQIQSIKDAPQGNNLPKTNFQEFEIKHSATWGRTLVQYNGNDRKVVIPEHEGIRAIGSFAFNGNQSMQYIVFPDTLRYILNGAFNNSGLQYLLIPKSVVSIGSGAFAKTPIESIWIQPKYLEIESGAFNKCTNVKEIEYDGTKAQWGYLVMDNAELTKLIEQNLQNDIDVVCSDGIITFDEEE